MKSIVSWGIDNKIIPNFKKELKIYVYKSLKRVSRLSLNHISFASTQSKENMTEGFVIWITFFLFFIRSIWKCVLVFKSVSWLWSAFNLSRFNSSLRSLRNCFIFSRVRWLHRLFVMLTYLTKCIYQEKKKERFLCLHPTLSTCLYIWYVLNSTILILQCWSYYVKLNSARHQHDTERTQNRAGCSHRQLFRPLRGSSVWRKNQRSGSDKKISANSDFSPDLELVRTHRITPYHVSSRGQESKCQVDVSQRKNFQV